jgi:hypothetical protein
VLLPHQLGEVFRAVFAGEDQIRHKLGFYGVFCAETAEIPSVGGEIWVI